MQGLREELYILKVLILVRLEGIMHSCTLFPCLINPYDFGAFSTPTNRPKTAKKGK